ncbi:Cu(I)-responsive transcriptional regulator [Spartinivicinus ruber]|uniref:Cu(I)-responsive transcriptional regulator n=1 Tax=Spartinivicinus ruber TaxID=2683272 RepID=UPI0013D17107|nr:Cu(I)-responsive transcriptional regulator [Spartinivicinus ruber]
MNISEVAKASGLTAKTIRYYESIGLIKPARRLHNGYRSYTQEDVGSLKFIHQLREFGFSLAECEDLFALYKKPDRQSRDIKAKVTTRLEQVRTKIKELEQLADSLEQMLASCAGDDQPECGIINRLVE